MINTTFYKKQLTDKLSICLSLCCILHCIALPVLILIIPSFSSFWINDENVHVILVFLAIPISLFAMGKSLRIHHKYKCIILAFVGLLLLVLAIFMHDISFTGEDGHGEHAHDEHAHDEHGHEEHGGLGEKLETIFTVFGGLTLFVAHMLNIRYVKKY